MLPPDRGVELLSRLGVSFIGFVYERSLGRFSMPIRHTPGRLQRESWRRWQPLVLLAGECHERLAQSDTELLEHRHQQFEIDCLERPVRCDTIDCTAADVYATIRQSASQFADAQAALAKECPNRRNDDGVW
jgi:hypothetical protein